MADPAPSAAPTPTSSGELVIETRGLTKLYGPHRAVSELELRVPRGTIFGLLGQNGAGKSTTIRMLLGLVRPSAGEVRLFGRSLAHERMALLGRVGCLVEGPAFYPYLTGEQNLRELGALAGGVRQEDVQRALARVGLGARGRDRYGGYSTGMRQRLGIAAALLHDPELVILDEPLNGLDPPAVLLVRDLIRELRGAGKTVLVSSHLLHEVELVCDQVAIVEQGRVVAQGEVTALLRTDRVRVAVSTPDPARAAEVARGLELVSAVDEQGGERLLIELREDAPARLNRALVEAGVEVAGLARHQRTLEELFHELAGAARAEAAA